MTKPHFIPFDDTHWIAFFTDTCRFFKTNQNGKTLIEEISSGMGFDEAIENFDLTRDQYMDYVKKIESYSEPGTGQEKAEGACKHKGNHLDRLVIHVSNDCNLRCQYCYAAGGAYGSARRLMSLDMLQTVLNVFFQHFDSITNVQIFGGEPLMNMPAVRAICEYVRARNEEAEHKTSIGLVTNATLIDAEFIELVKDYEVNVTISYDGDVKTNNELRVYQDRRGSSEDVLKEDITMAFTAADVKTLRERTNVGMMDCKKALTACDGDMDKAIEWLREKGLAKAVKKSGRIAAEGMAYAVVEGNVGVVVEVNCETDFCAKSAPFVEFVKGIAQVVVDSDPADVDALKKCPFPGTALTVEGVLPEKVMSIGENLQIRRFIRYNDNTSVAYVHAGGKIGVLVNLAVEGGIDATEIGKNVAMQIAALNPRFWDKADVTPEVLEEEKKVLVAQMDADPKMASKPAQVKEKIAAGKLNKFYEENCLLQQTFVRSDLFTGSVEGYIASAAKALGGKVTFVKAVRFEKGEGIEKKVVDFLP